MSEHEMWVELPYGSLEGFGNLLAVLIPSDLLTKDC
jgi:hypothetical protein